MSAVFQRRWFVSKNLHSRRDKKKQAKKEHKFKINKNGKIVTN
jgi:hypothetical protein